MRRLVGLIIVFILTGPESQAAFDPGAANWPPMMHIENVNGERDYGYQAEMQAALFLEEECWAGRKEVNRQRGLG